MLLVLDNYDSFVHNLARYLRRQGHETLIVRSDRITAGDVSGMAPAAIILSPGPQTPDEAGACLEITRQYAATVPMLGVCLGHQIIAQAFGGRIVRADPVHGMAGTIHHQGGGIFSGVPNPFSAGRYHSLVVDPAQMPAELQITAWTTGATHDVPEVPGSATGENFGEGSGHIMAIAHRELPIFGVQFHPESILTEQGDRLLANFLNLLTPTPNA